ncbi:MAG: hypothetical protein HQL07_17225 [Nitrospirae bacterium]|nr:hypothetical protein [Magnetococcales bacterium]
MLIDPLKILRRIFPGVVLLLLTLGFAGCAGGPGQGGMDGGGVEQAQVLRGLRQDQEKRRQLSAWWRVGGHVEMKLKDDTRRYRMELVGKRDDFIRMIVFGPFKNVVMSLTMGEEWLQLVNSSDHAILEVAADSRGMEALTGMAFNPAWMQPALMGCVGDLGEGISIDGGVLSGVSGIGEKVWVDGVSGMLKSRSRQGVDGKNFFVDYVWPETSRSSGGQPLMPEQVDIRLDQDSKLVMYLKDWNFYSIRPDNFPDRERLPSFPTLYPEIGDGIAQ